MNFNFGGPSYFSYSTSSSDDDDDLSVNLIAEEEATYYAIAKNNMIMIEYYLNQQNNQATHGGSILGHVVHHRDRETADQKLFNDYFSDNPLYDDANFYRQYRMSRSLFLRIVDAIKGHDNYLQQRSDGLGRLGLLALQKVTAVFRMFAYGLPADATDEYIKIGESTAIESVKRFCRAVVEIFAKWYQRSPTANDVARLLYVGQQGGFLGILGSVDCMHWKWNKCPATWARQYAGCSGSPTIILEAVADYDLWI